jgi:hypothetical protein
LKRYYQKKPTYKTRLHYSTIVGLLLIIIAVILLFVSPGVNQKISASLIFIGFVIILMMTNYNTQQEVNDKQLILIFMLLTWIVLIVTFDAEFDLYFVLLALGIFAIKEFINEFIDEYLQKRLNILFFISIIIFVIIIIKRIISLAGMYPG